MENGGQDEIGIIQRLRREWGAMALVSLVSLFAGFWWLLQAWGMLYARTWLIIAAAVGLYQFVFLWQNLAANRPMQLGGGLFSSLGPANWITVYRAVLTGMLAGFLLCPWPPGWLAWAPGILYLLIAFCDFIDGYVARRTHRTTRLGEILDMKWDGAGILVGAALAVVYGQAPVWFLLVGTARFVFLFGAWLLRRRGQTLVELDPSMIRRALAGMQMGVIGVLLLPVFSPPATWVAAILFMLPFLVHFTRDFFWVAGWIGPHQAGTIAKARRALRAWGPLGLRLGLVVLLGMALAQTADVAVVPVWFVSVAGLALLGVLMGAAGRLAALAALLLAGFMLETHPLDSLYWLLLVNSVGLFLAGTGRFSLWKPEEWLIYHRAGENAQ